MKHLITFSTVLLLSLSGMAQTGLVFNQCLTFGGKILIIISGDYYSQEYTVPEGKVWKIEHASVAAASNNLWANALLVNGYQTTYFPNNYSAFPIWVKSGDVIRFRGSNNSDYFLSILEFNGN
jgi:hypothetical protein